MSAEEHKAIIRQFITAFDIHNMEAFWEYIDPDCHFPVLTRFGIEPTFANYKQFMTAFGAALPDIHHTIEEMVAEEDRVWVNYTIRGTHEGPLRNIPATHKPIAYSVIGMYHIKHGKITQADFQADDISLLRQLGALPA